jgi:hypothetical protein
MDACLFERTARAENGHGLLAITPQPVQKHGMAQFAGLAGRLRAIAETQTAGAGAGGLKRKVTELDYISYR